MPFTPPLPKVYHALVSDDGNGGVTAIVKLNTLGGLANPTGRTINWSKIGAGNYLAEVSDAAVWDHAVADAGGASDPSTGFAVHLFIAPDNNAFPLITTDAGVIGDINLTKHVVRVEVYGLPDVA